MEQESLPPDPAPTVWPPALTLAPPFPEELPQNGIDTFPTQNVFLVLLFTVLTLGIYSVVWLSRQAIRINRVLPDAKINTNFLTVALIFTILGAGLDIVNSYLVNNSKLDTVTTILDVVYSLLMLFLAFEVRGRIHRLLGKLQSGPYRYSAVGTFFFGILYLQFKINQNRKRWARERPVESV